MGSAAAGISESDWLATAAAVRFFILEQQAALQSQQQEIQCLRLENELLRSQLTALASELAQLRGADRPQFAQLLEAALQ
jgi:hypothetical protein